MISGDQIQHLIAHPASISADQLNDLSELVEKFPYCSSLHMLLLKGMALENDLKFESQLKIAAAHVHDRGHLYHLIHTEDQITAVHTTPEKSQPDESEEKTIVDDKSYVTSVEEKEILENESKIIELENNKEAEQTEVIEDEEPITENNELEKTILTDAIDQNYVDTVLSFDTEIRTKDTEPETDIIEEEKVSEIEDKDAEAKTNLEDLAANRLYNEVELNTSEQPAEPLSFVEWLKHKRSEIASEESTPTEAKKPSTKSTAISSVTETKASRKSKTDALLEKFIAEEPKISRPVKDFYSPVKTAKKSVEESDDLVSETLAKIHLMQKNYDKAISSYQKLILLYPEKKTFFADQIKKIEEIKKK